MGLDSVEIVMKVENSFGIKIPDQEAEKIITVGDFHNVVWRHLDGKHSDKCKSQNNYSIHSENYLHDNLISHHNN